MRTKSLNYLIIGIKRAGLFIVHIHTGKCTTSKKTGIFQNGLNTMLLFPAELRVSR